MKITDPNAIVVTLDGAPIEGQELANATRALLLAVQVLARCELTYDGKKVNVDDVNHAALAHGLSFLPADAANMIRVAATLASTRASRARRAERVA